MRRSRRRSRRRVGGGEEEERRRRGGEEEEEEDRRSERDSRESRMESGEWGVERRVEREKTFSRQCLSGLGLWIWTPRSLGRSLGRSLIWGADQLSHFPNKHRRKRGV